MWTNLIHSFKTHCFDCVKQSYKLRVIFYLKEFCSLNTNSIKFLMSQSNQCHKNVWIYYYQSNQSTNKSHLLYWRLNIILYVFLLQSSSIIICSIFFQTNLIMSSHLFTKEHFKEFQNHFSQIFDADSLKSRTKSSSAASFIHEDCQNHA